MKRNMLAMAIFICLGIWVWGKFDISTIIAVAGVLTGYCIWCLLKRRYIPAIIAVFSVCIGFFVINNMYSEKMAIGKALDSKELKISGKVINCDENDTSSFFDIKYKIKDTSGKEKFVKCRIFYDNNEYSVRNGDIAEVSGLIYIPDAGGGFGDYNGRMNAFADGIILYVSPMENGIRISENPYEKKTVFDIALEIRQIISDKINKIFSGDVAGICEGIIAGKKNNISEETTENFRISGISHIIVVSGMHINIITWILMAGLSAVGIGKKRFIFLFYIVGIWFFVLITGAQPSACRAAIVATITFFGKIIKRETDSLNSLGVAVVIMLIVNPAIYFDVGFRLSVTSVSGILLFSEKIREKLRFLPSFTAGNIAVSLSAQIGILPVLAQSIGNISIYGIFINVIVCPIILLLVILIASSLIVGGVWGIGPFCVSSVNILIKGIMYIAKWTSQIPYASIEVLAMKESYVLVYLLLLAGLYFMLISERKIAKRLTLISMLIFVTAFSFNTFRSSTDITFLSTGDSDCSILRSGKRVFMFDGGGHISRNIGEDEVIPYMRKNGIEKIDAAFITHYHLDHVKGIEELIYKGKIKNIVIPVGIHKSSFKVMEAAVKTGVNIHYIKDADIFSFDDVKIEAYNTYDDKEENNGMVYFVSYGENRICIAGDVYKNGENKLIDRGIDIRSDILKVAHHGSDTSSGEEFIRMVSPIYGIVTTADKTDTEDENVKLFSRLGIKRYTTKECGSIRFKLLKGKKPTIYFGRNNLYELRDIKKAGKK